MIPVRIAGTGEQIMHNKFCLIDVLTDEKSIIENAHPQNGLLINGSMNWTLNVSNKWSSVNQEQRTMMSDFFSAGFVWQLGERSLHIRRAFEVGIQESIRPNLVTTWLGQRRSAYHTRRCKPKWTIESGIKYSIRITICVHCMYPGLNDEFKRFSSEIH